MFKHLSATFAIGLLVACAGTQKTSETAEAEATTDTHAEHAGHDEHAEHAEAAAKMVGEASDMGTLYGAAFEKGEPVAIAMLVASPMEYNGKDIVVEGQIRQVCQKMGCWFELAAGTEADMGVRVTSKEHNVYIPMDSAGKMATIHGLLEVREVSQEEADHYNSEGADVKPGQELMIFMSGVALK